MSVSLVKISPTTVVYSAGHNTPGYSPDPESIAYFATIEAARIYLADELDQLADSLMLDPFIADDESGLWASVAASAELVKSDRDGDVAATIRTWGGWATHEDTGQTLPTAYWINATTLGEAFAGDTSSDEYLDLIEDLQS
jgi:hypothetical protein